MKWMYLTLCLLFTMNGLAQNHSQKPIRFIFESIHDHLGNRDINSKRVQLFNRKHELLYEADLYNGVELDEQFFYYRPDGKLDRDHRIFYQPHESGDFRMIYDEKGNLVEERNVNDIDEVLEKITMTYNDKGQMITEVKEFLHHNEGKMIIESSFEFTYGDDGKIATKKGYQDEKTDQIVTYKYTHTANSEKITMYSSSNVMMEEWIQKTDDKGRLIQDVHTLAQVGRPALTKTIDFTYDKYDHILTETLSKSGSSVKMQILFEYTYDEYGNWTERKEKKIKGVRETEGVHLKRIIEYYEKDSYEHPPMEMDESYNWENHGGKDTKVFEESHVRINNNDGELEWVVRRNGQSIFQCDEFEYDKNGKLERINHLNNFKGENAYTLAIHNDKGQMTEYATYSFQDKIDEKTVYTYDDKGLKIKREDLFTGKVHGPLKTTLVEEYKYDGDKVVKTTINELGSNYTISYEYDGDGNLVKEIQTPASKDEELLTLVYEYEGGKLMKELEYEGKSKDASEEIRYKYDDRGELIQSTHYRSGKIHSEIDYVYFE